MTDSVVSSANVLLFPRRKSGQGHIIYKGRRPLAVDMPTLEKLFSMPQFKAARALGISLTALKHSCRKLGIHRWPYRRPKRSRAKKIRQTLEELTETKLSSPKKRMRTSETSWVESALPLTQDLIKLYMESSDDTLTFYDDP